MFIETVGDLPLKDLKTRFEYLKSCLNVEMIWILSNSAKNYKQEWVEVAEEFAWR